ncbi:uncharacterized protein K452DRAFT_27478 [Aplosporella prunicola CBS 121167]|uniref:Uncharacterized protein n=1 Tax=Aplosporella prunicola CBS 121167 TaxID=1176127 RepID=A0A6A6BDM3_9PEZI|nr:uncharacterized protein K452DRAFT_27478 [Aplosporella prunicola CBS 121167]KAF2142156.1 hypothetical protein K452DRAFT_27478 [Aplosporella prunicola CBS 121167]
MCRLRGQSSRLFATPTCLISAMAHHGQRSTCAKPYPASRHLFVQLALSRDQLPRIALCGPREVYRVRGWQDGGSCLP